MRGASRRVQPPVTRLTFRIQTKVISLTDDAANCSVRRHEPCSRLPTVPLTTHVSRHLRSSGSLSRWPLGMRLLIPFLLATAALVGCKRDEEAYVRRVVASVGAPTLVSDAAALASAPAGTPGHPEPPSSLPVSFRAFRPVETWRHDSQFVIVTARHMQHRVGIAVQPTNYPEPQSVGGSPYTRIAPDIYYYES